MPRLSITQKKAERFHIRLEPRQKAQLQARATWEGCTIAALVRQAIDRL